VTIKTDTMKNALATEYGVQATHAALYSTVPSGSSPGTELAGGSPAYARKAITWGTAGAVGPLGSGSQPATPGVCYAQVTFDVEAGDTVAGAGVHSAVSGAGNYLDGGAVTSQAFATQGTYVLNLSYTQT
jgi:hypothetical protein